MSKGDSPSRTGNRSKTTAEPDVSEGRGFVTGHISEGDLSRDPVEQLRHKYRVPGAKPLSVREALQAAYEAEARSRGPTEAEQEGPRADFPAVAAVADLMGGDRLLNSAGDDLLAAHDVLVGGLPGEALEHLSRRIAILSKQELFEQGLGISLRTYQRRREAGDKPLSPEQSGRLWKFAEILLQAAELLGSREEAEAWLARPAVGLNQRRPIDLLASPVGVALVEEHLGRLRYGIYA